MKDLYGKRKVYSAWGLTILLTPLRIFNVLDQANYVILLKFIWGFYFGANVLGKLAYTIKNNNNVAKK